MSDFELSLRKAIKNNFTGYHLQGCYFYYCKSIWNKIKKLNLFKKKYRLNTLILSFIFKANPFF